MLRFIVSGLLLFMFSAPALFAQSGNKDGSWVGISGVIRSRADSTVLPYVHIVNKNTQRGVVSDEQGNFSIWIKKSDTLAFSTLGYKIFFFQFPDPSNLNARYNIDFYLTPESYQLNPVEVKAKDYSYFKESFLNVPLPLDTTNIDLHLPNNKMSMDMGQGGGMGVSGPITAIYEKYSKKGRDRSEYRELVLADTYRQYLLSRYYIALTHITGMEDPDDIGAFIAFCNLPRSYIAKASDYEMLMTLKSCYTRYSLQKEQGNN